MRKPNPYTQILLTLKDLHLACPNHGIAHHLELATSEYGSYGLLSDDEFLELLLKYKGELEINTVPDKDLDKIIEEGKNLGQLFAKDDEDIWETPY